jgi:hypothetical protein
MIYSGPRLVYKFRADAAYYRTIIDRYYGQRAFLLRLPVQYGIVSLAIVGAFLGFKDLFTRTAVGIGMVVVALLTAGLVAMTKMSVLYPAAGSPQSRWPWSCLSDWPSCA